jgi:hypothetical protein
LAPDLAQLFTALRDLPADRDQLFGTFAGTVSPEAFFAPENVARIMGSVRPNDPPLEARPRAAA